MKKQLLTMAAFTLIAASVSAQQAAKINGQPFGQGDWFGSNNNEAVIFKANNNVGFKIKPNGEVVLKSLDLNSSIGPNGLVLTDGQGKLFRLNFPNDASKVLLGDGTFGVLPVTPQWLSSGNNLYWNAGNVSIGSVPNSFKLNVEGDVRVSHDLFVNNNMYVGGGIVISDKIQGVTEVKGWDFKVENDIQVTGTSRFNGATQLDQGFTFDGSKGIKFVPNMDNGGTFRYGNNNLFQPLVVPCAAAPTTNVAHQFGGIVQVFDPNDPSTGLLNFQTWTGGSSIDASVGGVTGGGGLLLNYFCGNNTFINTGANGGRVTVGNELQASRNVRIGNFGTDPFIANTSLSIAQNDNNGTAIKLNVWNGTVKAIDLVNPGNGISNFTVFQSGKTQIGNETQIGFHSDALLTVSGKMVAQSCYIKIADWADYVFADNYKLPSLYDIEKYYLTYKHLPEIPSEKEIIENGVDVAEMNKLLLKKIEELTIMMVKQQKEIDELKK